MKNLLVVGFAMLLICSSCGDKTEVSNEVSITGQIENDDGSQLKFREFMAKGEWYTGIDVQEGFFALKLPLDKPVIKYMTYGNTSKDIFLQPGETLEISFDALSIDSTFAFGGSLAFENELLESIREELEKVDYKYLSSQPLEEVSSFLDSVSSANQNFVDVLIGNEPVSAAFAEYVKALVQYQVAAFRIILGERREDQPENYYDFIDQMALDRYDYLDIWEYRLFLSSYIEMKANERLEGDSVKAADPDALLDESLMVIAELEDERIREYARYNALNVRLREKGVEGFETYYADFKAQNTDPNYTEQLKSLYEEKQLMAPGQPAPAFTLEDVDGNRVSLKDFKGKYVYIDFWQTLCPRSGRELPYLLDLYSNYKDENIEFVSISLNEDENVWREYVKKNKNMGTSLRVTESWDSKTYNDYQVFGLPAFVLIDRGGNIINSRAPKPSSNEIREIFDQLLTEQ